MRKTKKNGSFLVCLLFNLIVNFEWSIPAWLLLAAHFIWNISIWWFVGGLGFWLLAMVSFMWVVGWASECSSHRDPPKENKNPYSVKNKNG